MRAGANGVPSSTVPATVSDIARMPSGLSWLSTAVTRLRSAAFWAPSDAASVHGLSAVAPPVAVIRLPRGMKDRAACTAVSRLAAPSRRSASSSSADNSSGFLAVKALGLKCRWLIAPECLPKRSIASVRAAASVASTAVHPAVMLSRCRSSPAPPTSALSGRSARRRTPPGRTGAPPPLRCRAPPQQRR